MGCFYLFISYKEDEEKSLRAVCLQRQYLLREVYSSGDVNRELVARYFFPTFRS